MIDSTIGLYRILAKLGEGGMGEVYRARDSRLDRNVAIKVLPSSVSADPERLARLQREARTLAALNHPHIAQIYDVMRGGQTRLTFGEGDELPLVWFPSGNVFFARTIPPLQADCAGPEYATAADTGDHCRAELVRRVPRPSGRRSLRAVANGRRSHMK